VAGALYGAVSALLPFLKLNLTVFVLSLAVAFTVHVRMRSPMLVALPVSLASAALGVVAMWAIWFGFEHGWSQFAAVVGQGPKGVEMTLRHLAATTSVTVNLGSTRSTHGPDEVSLAWQVQTALLAVAPVLGALASLPKRRQRVI
jgi:hypothetical protein